VDQAEFSGCVECRRTQPQKAFLRAIGRSLGANFKGWAVGVGARLAQ